MIAQDWWQADYPLNNLAERIHKIKCKYEQNKKNCKICGIKYNDSECCLDYIKDDLIEQKCLCCNKNPRKVCWKIEEAICLYIQFL